MKKIIEQQYINMMNLELLTKKGDKYNFRCPYCGDSKKNKRKKRGYLIWNDKYSTHIFNCFNCDTRTNFYNFLEFNKPELLSDYKKECNENKLNSFDNMDSNSNKEEKRQKRHNIITSMELPENLIPCYENKSCLNYVLKRNVPSSFYDKWYYDKEHNSVLIPFYKRNEIYGYQSRALNKKYFHNKLPEDNIKIWNWYNIRISDTVIYTESIFDAVLMYNIGYQGVALIGKTIPKEIEYKIYNSGSKAIFAFDNDKDGKIQSQKYSKMFPEAKFLVWDSKLKGIKDIGELYDRIKQMKGLDPNIYLKKFIENSSISGTEYLLKSKLQI